MTTETIAQALAQAARLTAVSDSARLDAELLLLQVLEKPRSFLYTWPERRLSAPQQRLYESLLQRRLSGEPVAHILGYREFWTLSLEVDSSTLIPRPDTERLVELALQRLADGRCRVADLGTGSGAIALALASERPRWQVYGVEKVAAALALAERNRQRLGIDNVRMLQGSWCDPLLTQALGPLDMIVSNPPYIDAADPHLQQGDVRFEPRSALVSEQAGMADIERIAEQAVQCLRPGGWLLLEHGYEQGLRVRECLLKHGYTELETSTDLGGRERVTQGRRGA